MPILRRHLPWLAGALLLLGLLAALAIGSFWVKGFLQSDDFRHLVEEKTGTALRGEAAYTPLSWQGASVFSDQLKLAGDKSSPVKGITANEIRAEVNWRAIWGGAWRVDEIKVGYLEGVFGQPEQGIAPEPALTAIAPSGLRGLLPRRFELGALNVTQARLGFGGVAGQGMISLRDASLRIVPDGVGWLVTGTRGLLSLPGFPEVNVDGFRSRIQEGIFFLTSANFRLGETGKINASGEFGKGGKLLLDWQQVDVGRFLDEAWKSRLSGRIAGDAAINWSSGDPSTRAVAGKFQLTDGLLQNLPLLDQIATFTGAPQFRRMPLQQFAGNFTWASGQLSLSNLVIESKGLMRMEGGCVISSDGKIQGLVRLGVTPQTLQWLPGSRERVFNTPKNGYLWTDVRIAGTIENPQEDLTARLVNAAKSEVIQQGINVLQSVPGPASEGAKKALDILSPLIP